MNQGDFPFEGPNPEWPWERVEGNLFVARISVNNIEYEIYAKQTFVDGLFAYEIVEINEQMNLQLN